jgi:membrane peptidoglycan carboxypeptidase
VGFTPQLVVAVWVGYPDKLVPMTTEFHGQPVAGGTYPALIWKAFMSKALENKPAENFPSPEGRYAAPVTVVNRGGVLERDDGVCTNTYQLAFYGGVGPPRVATCKANEVEVPDVVGMPLSSAKSRLRGQPLTPAVIYKPAKTGDRVGYVVGQMPRNGTASAYDKITIILTKSLHGVVPKVTGLSLQRAQAKLARLKLDVKVDGDSAGKVVAQSVPASTASAPGEQITLTVKGSGG